KTAPAIPSPSSISTRTLRTRSASCGAGTDPGTVRSCPQPSTGMSVVHRPPLSATNVGSTLGGRTAGARTLARGRAVGARSVGACDPSGLADGDLVAPAVGDAVPPRDVVSPAVG